MSGEFQPHPEFENRRDHAWNKLQWNLPDTVPRGRFLDIGCGSGNGVIAALQHGFATAVGIDRDLREFPEHDPDDFDDLARQYCVDPSNALLVEGDLFNVSFPQKSFDCVMMLDSVEHVPHPQLFVEKAAGYVKSGGVLIIDTCPLYYSPQGSHLWGHIDLKKYPWAHLRSDFGDIAAAAMISDWSWSRFEELNKVTHAEVLRFVQECGLEVVLEHRAKPTPELEVLLSAHEDWLDWEKIPQRDLLFEDWILVVARRP